MSQLVQKIWGLTPPSPYTPEGLPKGWTPDPTRTVMGVELEIENTRGIKPPYGFMTKEDGSLRNNGLEYVSLPMRSDAMIKSLEQFFTVNANLDEDNYSERTSVHVHANVCDMTMEQVASVLLVYQVVEELLFEFVGHDRKKNIFCVPLSECATSYKSVVRLAKDDHRVRSNWSKYTALNLLPMGEIGTVEFRHMHGTNDINKLTTWVNIIECIMQYAKNNTHDEVCDQVFNLNTSSQYDMWMARVFGQQAALLCVGDWKLSVENGVLNAKFAAIGWQPKGQQAKTTPPKKEDDLAKQRIDMVLDRHFQVDRDAAVLVRAAALGALEPRPMQRAGNPPLAPALNLPVRHEQWFVLDDAMAARDIDNNV